MGGRGGFANANGADGVSPISLLRTLVLSRLFFEDNAGCFECGAETLFVAV